MVLKSACGTNHGCQGVIFCCPDPQLSKPTDLKVSDLLTGTGVWCEAALHMHITMEDAGLARQIPLSSRVTEDVLYWWPNSDGIYTTKSGY